MSKRTIELGTFVKAMAQEFDLPHENQAVTTNTVFRDLDSWDSMQALLILARVHDDYGVLLSEEELLECRTINDIYLRVSEVLILR